MMLGNLQTVRGPATQNGMTLVEVLVALVVISVGLLGVAALQLTSLRNNQQAYVRSQASVLASDILDRIRANHARRGEYFPTALNGTGTNGTIAGGDLTAWQAAIDAVLPGANAVKGGSLVIVGNVATVTIQWPERGQAGDNPAQTEAAQTITFSTSVEI